MELTETAKTVLDKRISRKNEAGVALETTEDVFNRVAVNIAQADINYGAESEVVKNTIEKFRRMLSSLEFIPNSPTLVNAGNELQQLSACFVLPVEDSMEGIFTAVKNAALIHKTGGGTGFSFSRLRGSGANVSTTVGIASGPVSFMGVFDKATETIKQGGTRRGANMGILHIDHPDIDVFINAKNDNKSLQNFNISVAASDDFMESVMKDNHDDSRWDAIVSNAWLTGDPGLVFIDRINNSLSNPVPSLGPIEATNPCLSGDTVIATLDGPRTFRELADSGKDVPVYAWHPDENIPVIRMMRNPRLTKRNAETLKIIFDSGLEVICTLNHSFWKFHGPKGMKKTQAQDLSVGDSIKAWTLDKHRDGHLRVTHWKDGTDHQWVHRMNWEANYGPIPENMIVHHADHNPENNKIENLNLVSAYEHNSYHYPKRVLNGFGVKKSLVKNHKIIAIEKHGHEDVYNGTVDDAHTYVILDPEPVSGIQSGIISANCGEQPLYPYDSCNLGSIDVSKFVDGDDFDWARLSDVVADAVHFLDNVIDMNKYPLPEIEEVSKNIRRIGLGVMGWADALIKLKIRYDSEEAVVKAEELMKNFSEYADRASAYLGAMRGTFPMWEDSIYEGGNKFRHSTRTTIAPTGTISIIAGCSSGIEPLFGLAFQRSHFVDEDPNKRKAMFDINRAFYSFLTENYTSTDEIASIIESAAAGEKIPGLPDYFITANEVSPEWHIKHQAAFQKYTDNAVSKTINLPNSATITDVNNAYKMAYELGCKGITVYRDGSKDEQVLSFIRPDSNPQEGSAGHGTVLREKLPQTRESVTHHFRVGDQSGYIIVGLYPDGRPGEVFIVANRVGSSTRGYLDTIGILTSFALQSGVTVENLAEKLSGVRFEPSGLTNDSDIPVATSIIDYVYRWIRRTFVDRDGHSEYTKNPSGNMCPECDGVLFYAEGCEQCPSCGYSKCG